MEDLSIVRDRQATKQALRLDVSYFDETEKSKFLRYPTANRTQEAVTKGVHIKAAQFLTYYLLHKKRPGKPGYRSYVEIAKKIGRALDDLDE